MLTFRDPVTFLPRPSYDLWEEQYGVHTFTASAVYAAFVAAARFAELLGKEQDAKRYLAASVQMQGGILKHLYDANSGLFYKSITVGPDGSIIKNTTCDSSTAYGLFIFKILAYTDERLVRAVKVWEETLSVKTSVGGIGRYEGDNYQRTGPQSPSNPWIITTLWFAQYEIARARSEAELVRAKQWLNWTAAHALSSGALSEQLDPYTGQPVSATPLTWSHSTFVATVLQYLNKLEDNTCTNQFKISIRSSHLCRTLCVVTVCRACDMLLLEAWAALGLRQALSLHMTHTVIFMFIWIMVCRYFAESTLKTIS
jgi:GH15 family glucan-1,4-alpha-glucosidase